MKNRGFKVMLLSILFIIPLMLVTINNIYSSPNPPPVEGHWMGPAVIADLTFTPGADVGCADCIEDGLAFYGEAECKGKLLTIEVNCDLCSTFTFDEVNEQNIPGWTIDPVSFFPPDSDCVPDIKDIKGIAVQTVINFDDYSDQDPPLKKATVILLFIVPKGK